MWGRDSALEEERTVRRGRQTSISGKGNIDSQEYGNVKAH